MPKLSLYKVGANGRVALGDNVKEGDFYTVTLDHDDDGAEVVVLTKVEVNTTTTKRTTGEQDTLPEV